MSTERGAWDRVTAATDYVRWRFAGRPSTPGAPGYDAWMSAYDGLMPQPMDIGGISIVCAVHDPPIDELRASIDSALAQTYPQVELVLVDDASRNPHLGDLLASIGDRRGVTVVSLATNHGISGALNRGVEASHGEHVVFLDHDDVLTPDALAWLAVGLADAECAYSDEDQLTPEGDRTLPFFKPAWSPVMMLGMNYVNHMSGFRRRLFDAVGGFDESLSGAQDHDVWLKVAERGARVAHVPKVLYHWRQSVGSVANDVAAKPWALEAARSAVEHAVTHLGIDATVADNPDAGPYRFALRFPATDETPHVIAVRRDDDASPINDALASSPSPTIALVDGTAGVTDATINRLSGWLTVPDVVATAPAVATGDGATELGWIVEGRNARSVRVPAAGRATPISEVAREVSGAAAPVVIVDRESAVRVGGFRAAASPEAMLVDLTARMAMRGSVIIDPTVTIERPTDPAQDRSHTGAVELSFEAQRADLFASPHLRHDGYTIDRPPNGADERLASLSPRTRNGQRRS